jgi:hypothetical protein
LEEKKYEQVLERVFESYFQRGRREEYERDEDLMPSIREFHDFRLVQEEEEEGEIEKKQEFSSR